VKKLILPIFLFFGGTAGGTAAGLFLLPPPEAEEEGHADTAVVCPTPEDHDPSALAASHDTPSAFVPLNNQFIVPLLDRGSVGALVILSLSVEVEEGGQDSVMMAEPRLRDAFLQVLFDHANTGGFAGTFTATETMRSLRLALNAAAEEVLGGAVRNVLIVDIVRQDI
jgi:hypothetical protein